MRSLRALQKLRSSEVVGLLPWRRVAADAERGSPWAPGLRIAVHAHIAAAFLRRAPRLLRDAEAVVSACEGVYGAHAFAPERAVMATLLGEPERALRILKEARTS